MRNPVLLSLALTFFSSLALGVEDQRIVDVFAWPLSATKSQSLAKVSYNSTTADVKSYTLPSISGQDDIVRIGFYRSSGQWSGIATAALNLAPHKPKKLLLHVRPDGELYHVGFKVSEGTSQSKGAGTVDGLSVEVVPTTPGPEPHLNKPVVLDADGKVEQKEPEKTFLQKYWWAIGLFLVLQIVGGGGGKE